MHTSRRGFTLIELLVVIAIIAILSIVVVLTLSPAELIRQSRDSNRLSDLDTLRKAVSFYIVDISTMGGTMTLGTASTTYISIADPTATTTAGTNCAGLGLVPATNWFYHCPASSTIRFPDGTGWLPVPLSAMSSKSPISALPVDPTNATSGYYYTYTPGPNNSYVFTALLESNKYLKPIGSNGSNYDLARVTVGSNIPLVGQSEGLVRNWPFEEGVGSVTAEIAGMSSVPDNGTFSGGGSYWAPPKIGTGAAQLVSGATITFTTNSALPTSLITATAWVAISGTGHGIYNYLNNSYATSTEGSWKLWSDASGNINFGINHAATSYVASGCVGAFTIGPTNWHFIVGTYDGSTVRVYLDGVQCATTASLPGQTLYTGSALSASNGAGGGYTVYYDDARLYSRAIPPVEISAIYKASN